MNNKKNNLRSFILFGLIFSILYILLAAKPLSKEYHFTPEWKINILNPVSQSISEDTQKIHFRLGQTLGYFTNDGNLSLVKTFPSKASISDKFYSTYNANANNTDFFYASGEKAGTINAFGYPYFIQNQIFVFLPGGSSFALCNSDGSIKWQYEGTIPVTAFNANDNYTVAGFADGTIKVFDNSTGNLDINFAPGGSDYPVILGVDISPDGQYIASISGHEKQRFVLSHREENQPKIIFHHFLNEDSPYRAEVHFCEDGERVIYNCHTTLGIYDLYQNSNTITQIKSRILSVKEASNLIFLLGQNNSEYTVYIVEKTNTLEGQFSFEAQSAFITTSDDALFVGKDNTISKILLTRE